MRLLDLSPMLAAIAPVPILVLAAAILFPEPVVTEGPVKLTVTGAGIKEAKDALMIGIVRPSGL